MIYADNCPPFSPLGVIAFNAANSLTFTDDTLSGKTNTCGGGGGGGGRRFRVSCRKRSFSPVKGRGGEGLK